jgi:hypothetical protein
MSRRHRLKSKPRGKVAFGGTNELHPVGYTRQRQIHYIPPARDTKQDISRYTQTKLMSLGRYLYANVGFVHGAINERSCYAVGTGWVPQFVGKDRKWGELAEVWLWDWMRICDLRAGPFDFRTDLFLASVGVDRDGDAAVVLTENELGYPLIQMIPAHRIGDNGDGKVKGGRFAGKEIYHGVIYGPHQRVIGYRIQGDDTHVDIGAESLLLMLNPEWCDQGRGITALSPVINDNVDIDDIRSFEKFAVKIYAMQTIMETNESGQAEMGDAFLDMAQSGNKPVYEDMDGGMIRYFRANAGTGIKAFEHNRPSPNVQAFLRELMRGCYNAIEWPFELSYDASQIGGANIRMIVAKAHRSIEKRQLLLGVMARRVVGYAIAKAIKLGLLPWSDEWYQWDFQMPQRLTVDAGREAQNDREDFKMGLTTLRELYGKRGLDWMEQIDQRIDEAKYLLDQCAKKGVDPRYVQLITPNEKPAGEKNDEPNG